MNLYPAERRVAFGQCFQIIHHSKQPKVSSVHCVASWPDIQPTILDMSSPRLSTNFRLHWYTPEALPPQHLLVVNSQEGHLTD